MRRRDFVIGGAALACAHAASGQTGVVPTIGFLGLPARVPPSEPYFTAFEEGLAEGGFVRGRSVNIDYRFANNRPDQLAGLAGELVGGGVSLIATPSGLPCVLAVKQAATTLPIVAILGDDAVEAGLIEGLNKPGGNVTGVIAPGAQMIQKQLELAHELLPAKLKVGCLLEANYARLLIEQSASSAGEKLGLTVVTAVVANEADLNPAFATFRRDGISCIVIPWSPLLLTRHEQITALAAKNNLPDIYAPSDALSRGGLMSYGANFAAMWRQLGTQTAKVLAGEKPAEIPVQFPSRIELRINLKTAKALGLTIPPTLLARADEVIE